jgi:hypothetical protein
MDNRMRRHFLRVAEDLNYVREVKQKVRTVMFILLVSLASSCTLSSPKPDLPARNSDIRTSIVGSWEVVHMSETPVPLNDIPHSRLASGRMDFKADGTFDGNVFMRGRPQGTSLAGTYEIDGDLLTIHNSSNNSTTKSKVSSTSEHSTFRIESHRVNRRAVTLKRAEFLTCRYTPKFDLSVKAATGQQSTIRAERHGVDRS